MLHPKITRHPLGYFTFSGAHSKSTPRQEDILTLTCPNVGRNVELKENLTGDLAVTQLTAFGKALHDLTHSERVIDNLTFGKRVALYELRGEIGSGNFSRVRLGIHDLTKGKLLETQIRCFTPPFQSFFRHMGSKVHTFKVYAQSNRLQ